MNINTEAFREGHLATRAQLALEDHVIGAHIVFPCVAYLELAFEENVGHQTVLHDCMVARDVAYMRSLILEIQVAS